MKKLLSLLVMTIACGGSTALDVCKELDAQVSDAGTCTFTPTHPPIDLDGGIAAE